jgi:hypothetical protein
MQNTSLGAVNLADVELLNYLNEGIQYLATNFPIVFNFLKACINLYVTLSIPLSLLIFIAIVIQVEKLKSLRKRENELYNAKVDMGYREDKKDKANEEMTRRWTNVLTYVESPNANDWRHAVIESDIILGDMLVGLGYRGEGIGEQLKRANKGDFKTLDEAWEAHKIRNELAHAGSDYPFSQFEARRVVGLYRKVFDEFFHI